MPAVTKTYGTGGDYADPPAVLGAIPADQPVGDPWEGYANADEELSVGLGTAGVSNANDAPHKISGINYKHNGSRYQTGARLTRAAQIFTVTSDHFTFEWLSLKDTQAGTVSAAFNIANTGTQTTVDHCIIFHSGNQNNNPLIDVSTVGASGGIVIRNCLLYRNHTGGTSSRGIRTSASAQVAIQNCTLHNLTSGVAATGISGSVNITCTNVLCIGDWGTSFSSAVGDYNASGDSTAPGTTHWYTVTASVFNSVTSGSENFHWADFTTADTYRGQDLSGTFTTDIDNETRGRWHIGADDVPQPVITCSSSDLAAGDTSIGVAGAASSARAASVSPNATIDLDVTGTDSAKIEIATDVDAYATWAANKELTNSGNFKVRIKASATGAGALSASVTVSVPGATSVVVPVTGTLYAAPTLEAGNPPDGTVGVAYSDTPTSTVGNGAKAFTIESGALPTGLSLNATTGEITGTPTTVQTPSVTVRLTDIYGNYIERTWSIDIDAALAITTTTLLGGVQGNAYSQTVSATGGEGGYTFTLDSGSLPTGLSLATSGVISGVPTVPGIYNFVVLVTDGESRTDTQSLSITIAQAPAGGPLGLDLDFTI